MTMTTNSVVRSAPRKTLRMARRFFMSGAACHNASNKTSDSLPFENSLRAFCNTIAGEVRPPGREARLRVRARSFRWDRFGRAGFLFLAQFRERRQGRLAFRLFLALAT